MKREERAETLARFMPMPKEEFVLASIKSLGNKEFPKEPVTHFASVEMIGEV